jgi:hypothetical protein
MNAATPRSPAAERPGVRVAVVMQRVRQPNRWEAWGFAITSVVLDVGAFGAVPSLLHDDGRTQRWLHPGLPVELFRDEAEGYHLNLSSGAPAWFVMWRIDDEDPSHAQPESVTLSYGEAARWLDSQERVDNLPLPAEVAAWLQAYTDEHYRPESRQRRRPQSFVAPHERGA